MSTRFIAPPIEGAGALLAAVLEGVDAVEGDAGYVFARRVDAEDAALVAEGVRIGPGGPG